MSRAKRIQVCIMGQDWEVICLEDGAFRARYPENALGITELEPKQIWLNKLCCTEYVIRHELCHAYIYECCMSELAETGLPEEFVCDLMGAQARVIVDQGKKIYEKFFGKS